MAEKPKSIERVQGGVLIQWEEGHAGLYPGDYLRRSCPCAVCKETPGHPAPQPIPRGKVDVKSAQPVGHYALQFIFSDGHDTGIFSYDYLKKICPCEKCREKTPAIDTLPRS